MFKPLKLPNCFPKLLYYFTFLPGWFESSSCSISLPVFEIVNKLFDFFLSCKNCLYILDTGPILDIYFTNMFFIPNVCPAFHLVNIAFQRLEDLYSEKNPFYQFFSFMVHIFYVLFEKFLFNPRLKEFLLCFCVFF